MTELDSPARRRRHARVIATAVQLVVDCGIAAQRVYDPIALAGPTTDGVPVRRDLIDALAEAAPRRLDQASEEDKERWPREVEQEGAEGLTTFRRRCATAAADRLLLDLQLSAGASALGPVPVPTPAQLAQMGPDLIAVDLIEALDDGEPEDALALLREAVTTGEYTTAQILDAAMNTCLTAACLTLCQAAETSDPSMAAETVLMATRSLSRAVMLASADLDGLLAADHV